MLFEIVNSYLNKHIDHYILSITNSAFYQHFAYVSSQVQTHPTQEHKAHKQVNQVKLVNLLYSSSSLP